MDQIEPAIYTLHQIKSLVQAWEPDWLISVVIRLFAIHQTPLYHVAVGRLIPTMEVCARLGLSSVNPMAVSKEQKIKNAEGFQNAISFIFATGNKIVPPEADYSFHMDRPKKDRWYFVIHCRHCGQDTPTFYDPSMGQIGNPCASSHRFSVNCYNCDKEASALSSELRSIQWP